MVHSVEESDTTEVTRHIQNRDTVSARVCLRGVLGRTRLEMK